MKRTDRTDEQAEHQKPHRGREEGQDEPAPAGGDGFDAGVYLAGMESQLLTYRKPLQSCGLTQTEINQRKGDGKNRNQGHDQPHR